MPKRPKPYEARHVRMAKAVDNRRPSSLSRPSAGARNYGRKWRKLRDYIIKRDPICKWPGCNQPTTDADHIIPRSQGGSDDEDNLQGLCHSHHSYKTATEDGGFGRAPRLRRPGRGGSDSRAS